jgi:hypothetical protein
VQALNCLYDVDVCLYDSLDWLHVLLNFLVEALFFLFRLHVPFYEYFVDVNLHVLEVGLARLLPLLLGLSCFIAEKLSELIRDSEAFDL